MDRKLLLIVEDTFLIEGRGLLLLPDFSVPEGGLSDVEELVTLEPPDGVSFEMKAGFDTAHLNIRDPNVPMDRWWRIVISLLECSKDRVPVGTRIFASPGTCDALLRKPNAQQAEDCDASQRPC